MIAGRLFQSVIIGSPGARKTTPRRSHCMHRVGSAFPTSGSVQETTTVAHNCSICDRHGQSQCQEAPPSERQAGASLGAAPTSVSFALRRNSSTTQHSRHHRVVQRYLSHATTTSSQAQTGANPPRATQGSFFTPSNRDAPLLRIHRWAVSLEPEGHPEQDE